MTAGADRRRPVPARPLRAFVHAGAAMLSAADGEVVLATTAHGEVDLVDPAGQRMRLASGALLILDGARPTRISAPGSTLLGMRLPLHLLTPRFVRGEQLSGSPVRDGVAAAVLAALISGLASGNLRASGGKADAIGGLLALVLDGASAPEPPPTAGEVKARALAPFLEECFDDPRIDRRAAALALGLSPRGLTRLLSARGLRFSGELARLRIARCRVVLADRRNSGQAIKDLAAAVGYRDLSRFARDFKRVTGMTPTAFRRAAKRRADRRWPTGEAQTTHLEREGGQASARPRRRMP